MVGCEYFRQPLTRKAFKPQTSQLTPDDGIVVEGQSCMNEAAQTPHMCADVNVLTSSCTDGGSTTSM
jgi:hypothetical protein